jgi:hypothetical protein
MEYPEWGFQGENFNVGISNVGILCFRVGEGLPTVAGSNVSNVGVSSVGVSNVGVATV